MKWWMQLWRREREYSGRQRKERKRRKRFQYFVDTAEGVALFFGLDLYNWIGKAVEFVLPFVDETVASDALQFCGGWRFWLIL